MSTIDYMNKMNNATNMKCVLSKFPFKLKEKWRSFAYDIKERARKRARFPDLVEFLYHQATFVNNPFGDVLDATSSNQTSSVKKLRTGKDESKRSSFTVNVSSTERNSIKDNLEKKLTSVKSASVF